MQNSGPLSGKTVLVTRPRKQLKSLVDGLRERGAEVVEAPVIRIEPPLETGPLDQAVKGLANYDWVVFTSVNGVDAFLARLRSLGKNERELGQARVAAIGPATAAALEANGLRVDVIPERFVAEEVFAALRRFGSLQGRRVLLPRADIAREALPDLLRSEGAEVDVVVAYRTVAVTDELSTALKLISEGQVDVVTFTSGSTVRSFLSGVKDKDQLRGRLVAASIGPITSQALREAGLGPTIEAGVYTVDGLIEAIERYFSQRAHQGSSPEYPAGRPRN
jgi:uroporphyrinogen III methyltransferase/synthase